MKKFPDLNPYSDWVNRTIRNLSMEEKIGQLLHPSIHHNQVEEILKIKQKSIPFDVGGVFIFPGTAADFKKTTKLIQEASKIPVLFSSDLENGAGRMIHDATIFPDLMSLAACNNTEFAYELGKACALEGRAHGIHWSFGPVVDINVNPNNPIANTRSLGDNTEVICDISKELVKGMQDYGLIATLKHFPGDGFDDRDQHICTTLNPLSKNDWLKHSGKPYQLGIDIGVWSIMIGHIALPSFEEDQDSEQLVPAVASNSLVTDLLKKKMGFKNLIITDAIEMGGVTGYKPIKEAIIDMINAGCDMLLFSDVLRDFQIIKQAVTEGLIKEERIEMAARKVLALKEIIGLHKPEKIEPIDESTKDSIQKLSEKIAQNAITLVKNNKNMLPLQPEKNSVFCYHIRGNPEYNVDGFDDLLKTAGFKVSSRNETEDIPFNDLANYDTILILATFGPTWGTSRIRPNGTYLRNLWFMMNQFKEKMIAISFGSPYFICEIPWVHTYINAYSPDLNTQKATLDILMGKRKAIGRSPVDLSRSRNILYQIAQLLE